MCNWWFCRKWCDNCDISQKLLVHDSQKYNAVWQAIPWPYKGPKDTKAQQLLIVNRQVNRPLPIQGSEITFTWIPCCNFSNELRISYWGIYCAAATTKTWNLWCSFWKSTQNAAWFIINSSWPIVVGSATNMQILESIAFGRWSWNKLAFEVNCSSGFSQALHGNWQMCSKFARTQ